MWNEAIGNKRAYDAFKNFGASDFSDERAENQQKKDPFPVMADHRNFIRYKVDRMTLVKPIHWLRIIFSWIKVPARL